MMMMDVKRARTYIQHTYIIQHHARWMDVVTNTTDDTTTTSVRPRNHNLRRHDHNVRTYVRTYVRRTSTRPRPPHDDDEEEDKNSGGSNKK